MIIRFISALIYDLIIACTLLFVFTAICMLANHNQAIAPGTVWYQISLVVIVVLYCALSLRYGGQTIGMRAFHFKINNPKFSKDRQIITARVSTIPRKRNLKCFLLKIKA